MKCSRCGHHSRTLPAMARHCRQKHPGSMKRKGKAIRSRSASVASKGKFCPHCGGFLG